MLEPVPRCGHVAGSSGHVTALWSRLSLVVTSQHAAVTSQASGHGSEPVLWMTRTEAKRWTSVVALSHAATTCP
eukprot:271265-Rhodomonas_salina.7